MKTTEPRVIVAIDPGASGGIAIQNIAIRCLPMPKAMTDLIDILRDIAEEDKDALVVMENVPKFVAGMQTSASAMATLHANVGYIRGVIDTLGLRLKEVKPKQWQSAVDAGEKKNYGKKWKSHLKDLALRRYPYLGKSVTLKTADALLILSAITDEHPKGHSNESSD